MSASILIGTDKNLAAIAAAAGNSDPGERLYSEGRLYVDGVTQAALEAAAVELDGSPTAAELLAAERAGMTPFYTAFRFAMKATPATGFAHLLDKVTVTVAAARATDPFSDLVIWADSVTQIVRLHPDMETFRVLFGLSETQLDDLCRLALQIEVGS